MRRLILTLFIIIGAFTASAEGLIEHFENSLKGLGDYRVTFTATMGDMVTSGNYAVSGSDFYIVIAGVEYYVAQGVKYEVNSERKEIVVDSAESMGGDLLSNPAKGFSILARDFEQRDVTIDSRKAVRLNPRSGEGGEILVVANKGGNLPQMIVYIYDDSRMIITLDAIESLTSGIPRFDRSKYPDYEVIDMR
ncbi:MAG: hypothetical protein IJB23_04055 [Alistipes sp.]|nr:hypothetical protein [Alistipes sp.]MBQ9962433.1 hypothetical protein [Alistipes sp.]